MLPLLPSWEKILRKTLTSLGKYAHLPRPTTCRVGHQSAMLLSVGSFCCSDKQPLQHLAMSQYTWDCWSFSCNGEPLGGEIAVKNPEKKTYRVLATDWRLPAACQLWCIYGWQVDITLFTIPTWSINTTALGHAFLLDPLRMIRYSIIIYHCYSEFQHRYQIQRQKCMQIDNSVCLSVCFASHWSPDTLSDV